MIHEENVPAQSECPLEADEEAIREAVLRDYKDEVFMVMSMDLKTQDICAIFLGDHSELEGPEEEILRILNQTLGDAVQVVAKNHPVEMARFVK